MNKIKIFNFFYLFISFLFLIYIFYRSEIFNGGLVRINYLFYYQFSLILIISSVALFYLNKKINIYFIIIITSFIVSLYLIEIYLHFFNSKEIIKDFDKRSQFQFYIDKKKTNQNIVLPLGSSYYFSKSLNKEDLLPFSGASNSETIFCNESGDYSFYESDRFGFNNPDEEWNKEFIDYLIVGDSFAHGACVDRPFDLASVLRAHNRNVINLGFSGNGPLTEYATIREYLKPNVKNILWFYYENDLDDLKKEMKNKILMNYLIDLDFSQNLSLKHDIVNEMVIKSLIDIEKMNIMRISDRKNKIIIENFINFIKVYETRKLIFLIITNLKTNTKPTEDFEKILLLANRLAIQNNSKLYFVYLPSYSRYVKNFKKSNIDEFRIMIEKNGIVFIDMDKEIFKNEIDPLSLFPFRRHNHYNSLGYSKIADKIYELTK